MPGPRLAAPPPPLPAVPLPPPPPSPPPGPFPCPSRAPDGRRGPPARQRRRRSPRVSSAPRLPLPAHPAAAKRGRCCRNARPSFLSAFATFPPLATELSDGGAGFTTGLGGASQLESADQCWGSSALRRARVAAAQSASFATRYLASHSSSAHFTLCFLISLAGSHRNSKTL